jgi:hypothetical protein
MYTDKFLAFSDTYGSALKKRKTAEDRSDLSTSSATEDKKSRHSRWSVYDDVEPNDNDTSVNSHPDRQQDNQALKRLKFPVPPAPVELQFSSLSG